MNTPYRQTVESDDGVSVREAVGLGLVITGGTGATISAFMLDPWAGAFVLFVLLVFAGLALGRDR